MYLNVRSANKTQHILKSLSQLLNLTKIFLDYQGKEKSFIELLELTADHKLVSVEQAITLLEKVNPTGINTEKIRTIIERKDDTSSKIIYPSDIEIQAQRIVHLYQDMLNEVSA